MQAVNTSAEPSQAARASLPRSIQRPTCRAVKTGIMAKPVAMMPSQMTGRPIDGPVGRRDADDEDQRLDERDVGQERDDQPVIDIALGRDAGARLVSHRRIVSRAQTGLA
jgi:hypothetical protein